MKDSRPVLVTLTASPSGPRCPFSNDKVSIELRKGSCVWLTGPSGAGKTTLSTFLAGLSPTINKRLDIDATCTWDEHIPPSQRCGVLFQTTTLLDELTVAGNLCVALKGVGHNSSDLSKMEQDIKALLETVGLDYQRDANKRPSQLSGGMGRRASLALQLAQKKHVIVLDEPFTGLDEATATSVAKELVHLRKTHNTALLLISHEPHIAKIVLSDFDHQTVNLTYTKMSNGTSSSNGNHNNKPIRPNLFGTTIFQRFQERLIDYVGWSLPLILTTFVACGLAIAMLSCDILRRIDVTDRVLAIVDKEVKPLLKMLNDGEVNSFHLMAVKMKVRTMLNSTVPQAKAMLYAMGMAKLFTLEVGPLLTALLLSGRIGGSYAGKVATMQATNETKLLRTLGVNPQTWTLVPSLFAAWIAAPIVTAAGTALALYLGGIVGPQYDIGDAESYWDNVRESIFSPLRLRCLDPLLDPNSTHTLLDIDMPPDVRTLWSDSYYDTFIEVITHPIVYHFFKAVTYITITMLTAEFCARSNANLTARHVPNVITLSVVLSSLLVIIADWGFSQLLLLRE